MLSMKWCLLLLLLSAVQAKSKKERVDRMFEDYWKWRMFISPSAATSIGYTDDKYASRLGSLTMEEINTRKVVAEMFLNKATTISNMSDKLDEQTELSLKLFKTEIQGFLDGLPYKGYVLRQATFLGGPHKYLPIIAKFTLKNTLNDYINFLSRLMRIPEYIEQVIVMMKEGIRIGRTEHFFSMDGVPKQIEKAIENDKLYNENLEALPDSIPIEKQKQIQTQGRLYLDRLVYPAYRKLSDFISSNYMFQLRPNIGISSVPNGEAFYQQYLNYYTTTTMTPTQIHQLGITEVAKIEKQINQLIVELGHPDMNMQEFSKMINEDPKSFFSSKEELMSAYRDAVYNKINPLMHKIFWKVPKQNITIVAEEDPRAVGAYYRKGSVISGRPGTFYIAVARYRTHSKTKVTTLSMHEANPGHHLHYSRIQENDKLPLFRKFPHQTLTVPSEFQTYVAFSEGWALYAEALGNELGLYKQDLLQKFGYLSFAILRAVRLVVDTGMHSLGWSRDKAIQYMLKYTPSTKDNVEVEINRYITWPGQACAYKVGELKIQELRERSEKMLADKYDIRDFHETVLNCYGPLNILEECVDKYIEKKLSSNST